jgi:hypothetical protein
MNMMGSGTKRQIILGLTAMLAVFVMMPVSNAFAVTSPAVIGTAISQFAGPSIDAPANLTAAPISPTAILLTWEDKSNNEIKFVIERRTGRSEYFQVNTVGSNTNTYSDTILNAGTTYYYRVAAYGAGGVLAYSNEVSANTLLPPNPVPLLFYPGYAYFIPTLTPLMQWSISENAITFELQVATDLDYTNLVIDETGIKDPYYDIPDNVFHWYSIYYWRVRALDDSGRSTEWSAPSYFRVMPSSIMLNFFCGCGS